MERDREQQGKRPVALPVTLVLLVLSLIGNVFLYSKYLQHGQDLNYEKGQDIGWAAAETASFYNAALPAIEQLRGGANKEDRMLAKFELGRAFGSYASSVQDFIAFGRGFASEGDAGIDDIHRILTDYEAKLRVIGMDGEPLTEEELSELESIERQFRSQQAVIMKFNFDAVEIRSSSIRIGAGYGWRDIAAELEQALLSAGTAE